MQSSPQVKLSIAVGGARGKTFQIKLESATEAAAWTFDEGSSTVAADRSGNGHDGTVSGAVWDSGYNGGALAFDGSASGVTVSDVSGLDFDSTIRIDVRVNFAADAGTRIQKIVEMQGAPVPYGLRVSASGKLGLFWNGSWHEGDALSWNSNQWYRLQAVHDGSAIRFYRDGVAAGSVANTALTGTGSGPLYIGRGIAGYERWFEGRIDDLIVGP
ncbi:LamG domain-containing protein [Paenibacillus sp. IB182496]|uniref:LamG domain-containing protein n=1 Tax=Paenibacillus sabuli TaxID=2772509 RepID=A0A927BX28_9BACL|nr:LamG domain-containing protein [Paenibacillus sabuli]MBD2847084.1 LamG domain-containing protein [Paenibacillus sabuli]